MKQQLAGEQQGEDSGTESDMSCSPVAGVDSAGSPRPVRLPAAAAQPADRENPKPAILSSSLPTKTIFDRIFRNPAESRKRSSFQVSSCETAAAISGFKRLK